MHALIFSIQPQDDGIKVDHPLDEFNGNWLSQAQLCELDERLKRNGGGNYFTALLARIRDIRSSEKVFWRKLLDIYATSIDSDGSPVSRLPVLYRTRPWTWNFRGIRAAHL